MDKKYIGAIDQGTTSTRFILFDREGKPVVSHQLEHKQIYPRPGWVEHDAMEIWERTQEVIETTLIKGNILPDSIAGIGITNQRETTVVWDKISGKPLYNALVWQDTRTSDIVEGLTAEGGIDRFRAKTGLPLATYFAAPKLRWLFDYRPDIAEKAATGDVLFGTIDSWLIWNLTGRHVTDVTNASRTMLIDLAALEWDDGLLETFGVPRAMLPKIVPSVPESPYGLTVETSPLGGGIPVCGCLGDQQAALFGQTCFRKGESKNTYGTGCFLLLNIGETPVVSRNGLITTAGYRIGNGKAVYALEGSVAVTGALVQWLRDNLGFFEKSSDVEPLARSVNDSAGVYIVPAFSGLYAPYWRPDARGVIAGLTRYVTKAHIARAALEATAYQTREICEAMKADSGVELTSLKVDGGMVVDELLMQFQADITGIPVIRPKVTETTALGAAYAAGLSCGFWKDTAELDSHWAEDKRWKPLMTRDEREFRYRYWHKAVERTFDWME